MEKESSLEKLKQKRINELRKQLFHSSKIEITEEDLELFAKLYNLDEDLNNWFPEYCERHENDLQRTKEYIWYERYQWQKKKKGLIGLLHRFEIELKWHEVKELTSDTRKSLDEIDKEELVVQAFSIGLSIVVMLSLLIIAAISPSIIRVLLFVFSGIVGLNIITSVLYHFGTPVLHLVAYVVFLPFAALLDFNGAVNLAIRKMLSSK